MHWDRNCHSPIIHVNTSFPACTCLYAGPLARAVIFYGVFFSRSSGEIDWSIIWGKPNPPLVIYWSAATLQPLIEGNEPLTMHGRDGNRSRGRRLTSNQPTIHWHCAVATVDIISYHLLYLSVVLMLFLFFIYISVIRAQKGKKMTLVSIFIWGFSPNPLKTRPTLLLLNKGLIRFFGATWTK